MLNSTFKEHPKGLYLLFFVEMWERFAYYGMRSMLLLYMLQIFLFSLEKASLIYGLYTGFVYLTPLIGGYIADRYLGQRKCITIGAILMATGLFGLCVNNISAFFTSLILMICANGMFKSNISTIVGMLYNSSSIKRDSGFTIFYMGINLGALLSPLICGTLAVKYGFKMGFLSAGTGMLIGLLIYKIFENKFLKNYGIKPFVQNNQDVKTSSISEDKRNKLITLLFLIFFSIIFWMGYEQAGLSLTIFAEYSTNRNLFNFVIPSEYFQSLNPLFIIIFAPIISSIWIILNKKNIIISSIAKFILAFLLLGIAYLVLALVTKNNSSLISPIWLVIYYFIATIAELCLSPIGLSLVSKLAPVQFASLFMGIWFLASFLGNLCAGILSGKYGIFSHSLFFLILSIILICTGIIVYFVMSKLPKID